MFESRHKLQKLAPQKPLKYVVFGDFLLIILAYNILKKNVIISNYTANMGVKMGVRIFVLYQNSKSGDFYILSKK